jgi:hypothetical protein
MFPLRMKEKKRIPSSTRQFGEQGPVSCSAVGTTGDTGIKAEFENFGRIKLRSIASFLSPLFDRHVVVFPIRLTLLQLKLLCSPNRVMEMTDPQTTFST